MLDFRHETFYQLCRIGSYTKTAAFLHLTQPAVSQHIRHLEKLYGGPLFEYNGKKLSPTRRGAQLYRYVGVLRADSNRVKDELQRADEENRPVHFGATLTIGEYVMPGVLQKILCAHPSLSISMSVGNTQTLLQALDNGSIDFALLEGCFDKSCYTAKPLSHEPFIPLCSPSCPLAGRTLPFDEITDQRLILREKGSGTREVLELALKEHNYSIGSFSQVCEIGNMSAIKQLVKNGAGISFMYKQAAAAELKRGELAEFAIQGFSAGHEFSFVFLKDSLYQPQCMAWFDIIRSPHTASQSAAEDA